MKITEPEVRYVADLANLRLTEDETRRMAADLDEILTHVGKLNQLDTAGVDPMAQVLHEAEGRSYRGLAPANPARTSSRRLPRRRPPTPAW